MANMQPEKERRRDRTAEVRRCSGGVVECGRGRLMPLALRQRRSRASAHSPAFGHRRRAVIAVRFLAVVAAVLGLYGVPRAEEIDRLLAAVNGKVITESDLNLARNLNVLVGFGKTAPAVSRQEAIDRLINREILRQELENFPLQPEDQGRAERRLEELKQGYAEIGGINLVLRRLGLQEPEIEAYIQLQVSMLRFIELRFRPFVNVADEEIRKYYDERLVPRFKESGSPVPNLDEVSEQIEGVLIEDKMGQQMDEWISDIRRNSRIEIFAGEPGMSEEAER